MTDQSGPGRNGNEGVLCIPQIRNITGTSSLNFLVSYTGHLGGVLPSAEVQSVISLAQRRENKWKNRKKRNTDNGFKIIYRPLFKKKILH